MTSHFCVQNIKHLGGDKTGPYSFNGVQHLREEKPSCHGTFHWKENGACEAIFNKKKVWYKRIRLASKDVLIFCALVGPPQPRREPVVIFAIKIYMLVYLPKFGCCVVDFVVSITCFHWIDVMLYILPGESQRFPYKGETGPRVKEFIRTSFSWCYFIDNFQQYNYSFWWLVVIQLSYAIFRFSCARQQSTV